MSTSPGSNTLGERRSPVSFAKGTVYTSLISTCRNQQWELWVQAECNVLTALCCQRHTCTQAVSSQAFMLAHITCRERGPIQHVLCREMEAAMLLEGADLDGAETEDTSGPLSATLAVQVWPKPVFRMPRSAFADLTGLPGRSCACDAGDESEDEVSMAGPQLAHD